MQKDNQHAIKLSYQTTFKEALPSSPDDDQAPSSWLPEHIQRAPQRHIIINEACNIKPMRQKTSSEAHRIKLSWLKAIARVLCALALLPQQKVWKARAVEGDRRDVRLVSSVSERGGDALIQFRPK